MPQISESEMATKIQDILYFGFEKCNAQDACLKEGQQLLHGFLSKSLSLEYISKKRLVKALKNVIKHIISDCGYDVYNSCGNMFDQYQYEIKPKLQILISNFLDILGFTKKHGYKIYDIVSILHDLEDYNKEIIFKCINYVGNISNLNDIHLCTIQDPIFKEYNKKIVQMNWSYILKNINVTSSDLCKHQSIEGFQNFIKGNIENHTAWLLSSEDSNVLKQNLIQKSVGKCVTEIVKNNTCGMNDDFVSWIGVKIKQMLDNVSYLWKGLDQSEYKYMIEKYHYAACHAEHTKFVNISKVELNLPNITTTDTTILTQNSTLEDYYNITVTSLFTQGDILIQDDNILEDNTTSGTNLLLLSSLVIGTASVAAGGYLIKRLAPTIFDNVSGVARIIYSNMSSVVDQTMNYFKVKVSDDVEQQRTTTCNGDIYELAPIGDTIAGEE